MNNLRSYLDFLNEKKPAGAPDFHHSDAPDANGRFKELGIKDLAAWLIKTRKKDVKKISGSLTQQVVFNRNEDPKYAEKMEKVRKEVYKQLGRQDLLDNMKENISTDSKHVLGLNEFKSAKEFDALYEEALLENDVRDLHFETDPKKAEEIKIAIGKSQGEVSKKKQIEGGEYSLRRFRKEIKYGNGKDLGVFLPGSYDAVTSTLGDGPHKKAVKKVKWNQRKYDQWLKDVSSNGGAEHAFDMAQNAKNEPGLIDWVKKQFRGDDPMQRIQWDIEAFAESVVTEAKGLPSHARNLSIKLKTHWLPDTDNKDIYFLADTNKGQTITIDLSVRTGEYKVIDKKDNVIYQGGDPYAAAKLIESVVTEAKAYKLKASEFGGDTHSAAYNVKGETTWRVHSTYAIDQVSGENDASERDVVFFEAMPINNDIYIKIGGINNLKRTGSTVGNNFGTTIEEWKKDPKGIAKEASDFLTDATHLKWINKKARSQGQTIKWALKDDYSGVIEDLVNKSLGLKESQVNEAKNTIGLAFKEEQDYLDFKEFVAEQPRGVIRKNIGFDSKTKSWNVEMDVKVLDRIYGEGTPSNKESGWYGGLPDDFESVIIESVVAEAKKFYNTKEIAKMSNAAGDIVIDAKYAIQDLGVAYGNKVPAKELDKVLYNYDLELEDVMESIKEAKLSKIHNAAKKGSYPVSLVVIENGKVIKQELVGTPQIVPAAFNQLKKEYPNAVVHVEDRTGKRLFSESFVSEAVELEDVYELIAHHKFDKDFKKLSSKDREWVKNDAKERGFTESLTVESFKSLLRELNEAKPGPDGYMTGLNDEDQEDKEDAMDKQAEMDDDDPDAYKELPGDKEAQEKGKVKTSKHVKSYHELYGDKKDESIDESIRVGKVVAITKYNPKTNRKELVDVRITDYTKKPGSKDFVEYELKGKKRKVSIDVFKSIMESNINEEKAEGDRGPIDDSAIETGLKNKAKDTGVPIALLRLVMRRGLAAWKSGHRPGATQQQWGYARVNSFLTKQPGTWGGADKDIAKEVRDGGHDSKLKKA